MEVSPEASNHVETDHIVLDDHEHTLSTAPTMLEIAWKPANPYELFEKFLSFVDTDEELNPVLSGYFCKLF
jgi:hypothetical protein